MILKVKIYRGTKEIGGTCVQITADNGKILWIDLGAPLSTTNPDTAYRKNKVDALLISHPHQDHFGFMESVGSEVPVYIGQVSEDLIKATKRFLGVNPPKCNFQRLTPWDDICILDTFKVYPYLVDHSSPEALAFVIEVDGKRVFYSGDFRSTGRKGFLYDRMISNPPKPIDLLLIEGTMIERGNPEFIDENAVEQKITEIVANQQNSTFVVSSDNRFTFTQKGDTFSGILTAKLLHPFFQKTHIDDFCSKIRIVNNGEEINFEQSIITDNMDNADFFIIDRQVTDRDLERRRIDLLALRRLEDGSYRFVVLEVKLGKNKELADAVAGQLADYISHIETNLTDYADCFEKNYEQKKILGLLSIPPKTIRIDRTIVEGFVVVGGYTKIAKKYIAALKSKYVIDVKLFEYKLP